MNLSRHYRPGQNIKVEGQPGPFVADVNQFKTFPSKKGKNVFLLSTMYSVPGRCEANVKPENVLNYNKSKGGVDTMDQIAYAFFEEPKRWLLVVLFNIFDLSTNATRVTRQARLSEHKLSHDDN
ncbi:PiggyBac transposable element-derived protein 4 [Plakobranchus ocellatus]|uniref:PiggyBac transposable element-derived protein 4 n=1 Tax=Plakobranchus ocellatus TaxID=259542 RepID=A0AAV4CRD7_9GAST|nr:PiggyBac transposable element-derived protein 4 [Plakobranchus ocellatus]